MSKLDFTLHDAAGHTGDTLKMVMRTMRQVGVFDGEAGDEIFGALSLVLTSMNSLRDGLDPAFVSIVPVPPAGRSEGAARGNAVDLHPAATEAR